MRRPLQWLATSLAPLLLLYVVGGSVIQTRRRIPRCPRNYSCQLRYGGAKSPLVRCDRHFGGGLNRADAPHPHPQSRAGTLRGIDADTASAETRRIFRAMPSRLRGAARWEGDRRRVERAANTMIASTDRRAAATARFLRRLLPQRRAAGPRHPSARTMNLLARSTRSAAGMNAAAEASLAVMSVPVTLAMSTALLFTSRHDRLIPGSSCCVRGWTIRRARKDLRACQGLVDCCLKPAEPRFASPDGQEFRRGRSHPRHNNRSARHLLRDVHSEGRLGLYWPFAAPVISSSRRVLFLGNSPPIFPRDRVLGGSTSRSRRRLCLRPVDGEIVSLETPLRCRGIAAVGGFFRPRRRCTTALAR